jgi:hypothetical protein
VQKYREVKWWKIINQKLNKKKKLSM